MKTATILSSIALVLPAFAAPAPPQVTGSRESGVCPGNNNAILTSNNNESYKVHCRADLSTKVIRVTDTQNGIQGCLTACDGTFDCDAVTFVPSNTAQTTGKCYNRKSGTTKSADKGTAVAVRVSGGPTTTITTWPATSTTSAVAVATSSPAPVYPKVFGGLALRSGSAIHFANVNANGTNFWLNKGSATYCPGGVVDPCPAQNSTIFVGGNTGGLALDVTVPGGQQVYVDSAGALRYTIAHSGNTGVGSSTKGFSIADNVRLQYKNNDWLACPYDDVAYVVFSATTVQARTDCLSFSWRISELNNPTTAWQYV